MKSGATPKQAAAGFSLQIVFELLPKYMPEGMPGVSAVVVGSGLVADLAKAVQLSTLPPCLVASQAPLLAQVCM